MMPTMTAPAYWNRELLKMPEVRDETLKMVSISLGSPSGLIIMISSIMIMMMISLPLVTKN